MYRFTTLCNVSIRANFKYLYFNDKICGRTIQCYTWYVHQYNIIAFNSPAEFSLLFCSARSNNYVFQFSKIVKTLLLSFAFISIVMINKSCNVSKFAFFVVCLFFILHLLRERPSLMWYIYSKEYAQENGLGLTL